MDKAGIRLMAHGAVSDDDNLNLTGDAALGLVSVDDYSAAHPSEMNKKFTADFARLINGGRPNALMSTGSSGGASCIKVRIRPAASVPAQRDDDCRRFEIQMRHGMFAMHPQKVTAQAISRRRSRRHQQIHIARAGAQRFPAGLVKPRTEPELHRRGTFS